MKQRFNFLKTRHIAGSKWMLAIVLLFCLSHAQAQQEALYSQYMFNRLVINPAYAGTKEYFSLTALGRWQWTGFDGAPETGSLSGHFAAGRNKQHGIGAFVISDQLGAETKTAFGINYAFRIRLDNDKPARKYLSLGIQAAGINWALDRGKITTRQPNDPAFPQSSESVFSPDFGFGAFFKSRRFYAGASVAHLVEFELPYSGTTKDSKLRRHYFATTGIDLPLNKTEDYVLTPSVMARYAAESPVSLDLNLNFMMVQKFWIGAGYRIEDAVVLMAGVYPHRQLRIGYSYDITTSRIQKVSNGSHEVMVSFDFGDPQKRSRVVTPRYF